MTITLDQAFQIGVTQFDTGQLAAAEATFRRVLAVRPDHREAWHRLGLIAMAMGRAPDAVSALQRAIAQPGATAMQVSDLGVAYCNLGRPETAAACFQRALELQPDLPDVHYNLGNVLESMGRPDDAMACYERALALRPGYAAAHNNVGNILVKRGHLGEAIAAFQRAISFQPDSNAALSNLGDALTRAGREEEAIEILRHAVTLYPNFAEGHNNLGTALWKKKRHHEAEASFRRALALNPQYAQACSNLGSVHMALEQLDEAIACYEQAVALEPALPDAYANMGVAFMRKGEVDRAIALGRKALECDPQFADGHWNLSVMLLLAGQWEEGWREHEWRWRTPVPVSPLRHFTQPEWNGTAMPGRTLLVHAEQGFGDTIQFSRYLPRVRDRARAARLIVEVPSPLLRLLQQSQLPGMEFVARTAWDASGLPPFDAHLPLLSQPLALGEYAPLQVPGPYLHADPSVQEAWRARLPSGFRVGIAWAGKAEHTNDANRSIAFDRLRPLLGVPMVSFISLQWGAASRGTFGGLLRSDETEAAAPCAELDDSDFADTAALIAELDLVISVDTAVAHLAGALGKPVWLMLPFAPDWRWGTTGDETPWYPTMRLYRQRKIADWDEVIARVAADVGKRVRQP